MVPSEYINGKEKCWKGGGGIIFREQLRIVTKIPVTSVSEGGLKKEVKAIL